MSVTAYQQFVKPEDREAFLELLLQSSFEDFGAVFGDAHVEGLKLEWVSGTSIKVLTGAADIPDGSRRLRVATDITVSSISLGASNWGHAYLYNNAGVPAVEVVSTAPVRYTGTAHQKTGDATRRYLGSVRTDGAGNIHNFQHDPRSNLVLYRAQIFTSPFQLLAAGVATTRTAIGTSAVVPATSRLLLSYSQNTSPNANGYFGNSLDSVTTLGSGGGLGIIENGEREEMILPLNASQEFQYAMNVAPSSGGLYVTARGYWFER